MKKIFFLTLIALMGISQAWAENAKKDQGTWEGSRDWTGPHASFRVDGDNAKDGNHLDVSKNADQVITWTVDEGYVINVTAIKIKIGHSLIVHGGTSCDIYLNGEKVWNVGTTTGSEKEFSGYNLGADGSFTLKFSTKADLYYIDITYDITPITYYVAFHGNGNNAGEMENLAIKYDETKALTENAFAQNYTFTYDANGGSCGTDSEEARYTFEGWAMAADGEVVYADKAEVKNLTSEADKVIDLYAVWTPKSLTLPTPSKEGSIFDGWYDADDNYVGKAGDELVPTKHLDLTAKWADKLTPMFVLDKSEIEIGEVAKLTLDNVDEPSIAILPEGIVEFDAEKGEIKGIAAGDVVIAIKQEVTGTIAGKEEELKLTVTKITPSFAVVLAGVEQDAIALNPGQKAAVEFNTNSDGDAEVTLKEGAEYAIFKDGEVEALNAEGTAKFLATLPETETYKGATAEFTVAVARAAEAEDCYMVLEDGEQSIGAYSNNGGLEYDLPAPGTKLIVNLWKTNLATNSITIYGYDKDNNESTIATYDAGDLYTSAHEYQIAISEQIVRIKFKAGGTLNKYFSNARVVRKGFLEAENVAFTVKPKADGESALVVKYSIANGGDLKIVCDNDLFTLDKYVIADVDCKNGEANIPVHFAAQTEEGEHVANVTIYNGVYSKSLTITAKVEKETEPEDPEDPEDKRLEDKVIWEPETLAIDVKEGRKFLDISVESGRDFTIESTDEDIARIEEEDGLYYLVPVSAGEVTIKVNVDGDETYKPAHKWIEFTITDNESGTGCENVEDAVKAVKVLRNGQIFILRDGKVYTVSGLRVE